MLKSDEKTIKTTKIPQPRKDAYFCCPVCGKVFTERLWDRHGYSRPKEICCDCGQSFEVKSNTITIEIYPKGKCI